MPSDARASSDLPDINDRLVEPETRYEMVDGELIFVSPSDPPHAERHFQLCALVEAHTGPGFEAACDLLTRTSQIDDFAPDVSVYPDDPDPRTGRRQIEQLAFEIVSTQSLANAGRKAAKLTARGVRRVFAIDIERSRALEWSTVLGAWSMLDATGHIVDPALEVALPIEALVHSAKADDAVARALVARHNPVIEAVRAEGKAEGIAEGKAEGIATAILAMLAARGVSLDRAARDQILGERDVARLERWVARATTCASADELLSVS
jgi:Uma2 family endonuclease